MNGAREISIIHHDSSVGGRRNASRHCHSQRSPTAADPATQSAVRERREPSLVRRDESVDADHQWRRGECGEHDGHPPDQRESSTENPGHEQRQPERLERNEHCITQRLAPARRRCERHRPEPEHREGDIGEIVLPEECVPNAQVPHPDCNWFDVPVAAPPTLCVEEHRGVEAGPDDLRRMFRQQAEWREEERKNRMVLEGVEFADLVDRAPTAGAQRGAGVPVHMKVPRQPE
jgi:hypothetical protein